jgi:hypothetical protein
MVSRFISARSYRLVPRRDLASRGQAPGPSGLDLRHFERLREKINTRLRETGPKYAKLQIEEYRYLYGALGAVPADVMFICENPSLAGVAQAHVQTIDGGPPDIEAQWWGGPTNNAAKRFRAVLHELGLKTTRPEQRGGWQCYITNVIKEANVAGEQNALLPSAHEQQARIWADILDWEVGEVSPRHVFCVGGRAAAAVKKLQREGLLRTFPAHKIWHYSARGSDERVKSNMIQGIRAVLEP